MNWLGKLVQKEINKKDTVLDIGCGIMQSTLDTCPTYSLDKLKCHHIIGVDIYRPYLKRIKDKKNISVLNCNIIKNCGMFLDRSFDVVLLLDIIEHLVIEQAINLVWESERIARKKVIIYTPSYWYDNAEHSEEHFPYTGLGDNEYQIHQSLIEPTWLEKRGYTVSFPEPDKNTYAVKEII